MWILTYNYNAEYDAHSIRIVNAETLVMWSYFSEYTTHRGVKHERKLRGYGKTEHDEINYGVNDSAQIFLVLIETLRPIPVNCEIDTIKSYLTSLID